MFDSPVLSVHVVLCAHISIVQYELNFKLLSFLVKLCLLFQVKILSVLGVLGFQPEMDTTFFSFILCYVGIFSRLCYIGNLWKSG